MSRIKQKYEAFSNFINALSRSIAVTFAVIQACNHNALSLSVEEWLVDVSLCKKNRMEKGRAREKVLIYFYGANNHGQRKPPHYWRLTITFGHTSIGSTPLDEWSAQRWDRHLIRRASMALTGFAPTIPAVERLQTSVLDRAASESRLTLNHLLKDSNSPL
jgi:hypothetical protein